MIRRLPLLVSAALVGAFVLAGCGGGTASLGSADVAVVGGDHITRAQFDQVLKQAQASYKQQKRPFPKAGSPEYEGIKNQIMAFLVQKAEYGQKAKDLGVKVEDKQVDERLAQLKKQYFGGSQTKYEKTIKAQGFTDAQVRDQLRTQLISEGITKKVTSDVKVSEDDIEKYFKAHQSQYPPTREVRHILVKKKALADQLYDQLKDGANFGKLARKYSQDPGSKSQGGKYTATKGQTVPQFDKAAFSLATNELSRPVKTTFGWHIIQPLAPVHKVKIKDVEAQIRSQLEQTKKQEALRKWQTDVKKDFDDKIRYAAGFAPPSTGTTGGTTTG